MIRTTTDLVNCSADALADAFDHARTALVPDLATCGAGDLARAFARARAAVSSANVTAERVLVNVTARR